MSEEQTAPKRLRAGDVIDQLQRTIDQLTTRSGEPYVTVEFTRNAKGETQISTKISAPVHDEGYDLHSAATAVYAEAQALYEKATMRYPSSSGKVTNDCPPFD